MCFRYAVTAGINHEKIGEKKKQTPQRITKIRPLINQYHWKETNFPAERKDWKKFETNKTVTFNILFLPHNNKEKKASVHLKTQFKA